MPLNIPEIIATVAVIIILVEIRLAPIRKRLPDRRLRFRSND